jgi:hypothetical protein
MRLPGAASLTEHWLACAVKATDISAPRPAASIISTPQRSITTRRVWGASSAIADVLLVFCYLIVPSLGAMLFADRVGRRLAIGWTMGTLVSALGVYFSVLGDLPTGATIVCTFGGVLVVMFFVPLIFFRGHRAQPLEGASSAPNPEQAMLRRSDWQRRVPVAHSEAIVRYHWVVKSVNRKPS